MYHISNCFNPRPREEATNQSEFEKISLASFNPRPREEATVQLAPAATDGSVSIHAPVRRRLSSCNQLLLLNELLRLREPRFLDAVAKNKTCSFS